MFSRNEIKNRKSVKEVQIEGWGNAYIRRWTGAERIAYLKNSSSVNKEREEINTEDALMDQVAIVAIGLCDSDGNRLYTDDEVKELNQEIDAVVIEKLFEVIAEYNGLNFEEALKAEIKN